MRTMILAAVVAGGLALTAAPANAQVGVMIGNPYYGSSVTIGQPYSGYGGYYPGYGGLGYSSGVSMYSGTQVYSSGYGGYVAPPVYGGGYYAPRVYGGGYYAPRAYGYGRGYGYGFGGRRWGRWR